uniref:Amino acid transporter transmembrane domain-containing protein n=1 Tax=Helicotheca tamesis TaxID=374047 RepID=A0A7S2MD73_9STRA|mmetsp:Transcript_1391/g.1996  ORF Transcript_1391/g.1996 Transcript_1391/m.1996 type:complete len:477 (+) Transcript_1391:73-1503(+)|eukprot:CAMPEP_0185738890 /NCGR_PEP_ID=MMETSP1171-20130828/34117_1 /TAXON_ID=374046 /ORGANISM="Helicotheca tamensis, Strain CCMP826" /LENGTH=476 /DNA_ID=CAMNT_0028410275 /DNA_START=62 /DNA_END=1492 /DNA_ORIENTATION=+
MKPPAATTTEGGIRGQALLVAGSAVGAGLIALPSVTWRAGFIPSSCALIAVWAYMSSVGILLLEASSWMDYSRPANLSGVVSFNLGPSGRPICIMLYISIYAATITAYIAEGGQQATELLGMFLHCVENRFSLEGNSCVDSAPEPHQTTVVIGKLLFTALFCGIIFKGPSIVERINAVCMCGAILVFFVLVNAATYDVDTAVEEIEGELSTATGNATDTQIVTAEKNWGEIPGTLPVMVVAFSYHNMVPSVFASLGRHTQPSALALLFGSGIALFMYLIWQGATIGGSNAMPSSSEEIFDNLRKSAGVAFPVFSFLAIVTSVLGVGLGCVDFMEDVLVSMSALKEKKGSTVKMKRAQATILTFGPCLVCALAFPDAFLPALEFSAIFRQILFGIIPVAMVWRGRKKKLLSRRKDHVIDQEAGVWKETCGSLKGSGEGELLPGGNIGLGLVAIITGLMLVIELNHVAHIFVSSGHSL